MTDAAPQTVRKVRRRRRSAFALFAWTIGLALGLVLLEIGFRLFWQMPPWFAEFQQSGMYVQTDDGSATLLPGYRGKLKIGDAIETTVEINSLGLRGPELGNKQPGERRILMLGDSVVFGYGVETEEALPASLQRELASRKCVATVGNAGIPSFSSRHYVAHMARLEQVFAADSFILCGFLGNDPVEDTMPERVVYAGMLLNGAVAILSRTSWRTRLALRSRAALWVESWIVANEPTWSPLANVPADPDAAVRSAGLPSVLPNRQLASLFFDHRDDNMTWVPGTPPVIPRLCALLRESLLRAKTIAGERPVVFVILPTSWHIDEEKRKKTLQDCGWDPADYERGRGQQRWLAIAKEVGIPAFDATPVLAAAGPSKELFVADGGHLSARGNEVVARWLAEQVTDLLR